MNDSRNGGLPARPLLHLKTAQSSSLPIVTPQFHIWQRWRPLWYGVFYVVLIVATIPALVLYFPSPGLFIAILGCAMLLGLWYGLYVGVFAQYLQRHPLLAFGYLGIGWMIWFGLTAFYPLYLILLFGLYPQTFFFRSMPWKVIDALILAALSLWRQILLLGGLDESLLVTLAAAAAGILIMFFIEAIIRQSRERHLLLRELEETRHELAVAERQRGVVEERQRLAREIHDTLVQGFTSIVMHLEAAEGVISIDTGVLQRHLDQARRTARENLAEARRLMWALQPQAFDHASLPEVLINLAKGWSEEKGVAARATITGTPLSLRPEIEVTLLRSAQEALANVGKYARASQVILTLSYMEDVVVLDVQDDGCGFDASRVFLSPTGETSHGFGLRSLRERVGQLGGTLSVESMPGEGTTIAVSLPAVSNEFLFWSVPEEEVSQ